MVLAEPHSQPLGGSPGARLDAASGPCDRTDGGGAEIEFEPELLPGATSWTPRLALERAATAFREVGVRGVWFRAVGELGYRRLRLLERSTEIPPPEAPHAQDVGILEDPSELRSLRPSQSVERIARRIARGEICFVARHRGRVVSATWAARGSVPIPYLACILTPAADEVFLSETITLPEQRRRGYATAVARAQIEHFRAARVRRLLVGVLPENRASLRARAKAGYRPCGWAMSVGLGSSRLRMLRLRGPDRGWTLEPLR